eukprot:808947_1
MASSTDQQDKSNQHIPSQANPQPTNRWNDVETTALLLSKRFVADNTGGSWPVKRKRLQKGETDWVRVSHCMKILGFIRTERQLKTRYEYLQKKYTYLKLINASTCAEGCASNKNQKKKQKYRCFINAPIQCIRNELLHSKIGIGGHELESKHDC